MLKEEVKYATTTLEGRLQNRAWRGKTIKLSTKALLNDIRRNGQS